MKPKQCLQCLNGDSGCSECGTVPSRLVYYEQKREMIRAATVRLCAKHESTVKPLCSHCLEPTDVYIDGTTICPTCHYAQDFLSTRKVGICKSCSESQFLNEEGICVNCFVDRQVFHNDSDEWGRMKKCDHCHRQTKIGNRYCSTCKDLQLGIRICRGCSETLRANHNQVFCGDCLKDIERGICTSCKDYGLELDDRGWCGNCEKLHG